MWAGKPSRRPGVTPQRVARNGRNLRATGGSCPQLPGGWAAARQPAGSCRRGGISSRPGHGSRAFARCIAPVAAEVVALVGRARAGQRAPTAPVRWYLRPSRRTEEPLRRSRHEDPERAGRRARRARSRAGRRRARRRTAARAARRFPAPRARRRAGSAPAGPARSHDRTIDGGDRARHLGQCRHRHASPAAGAGVRDREEAAGVKCRRLLGRALVRPHGRPGRVRSSPRLRPALRAGCRDRSAPRRRPARGSGSAPGRAR